MSCGTLATPTVTNQSGYLSPMGARQSAGRSLPIVLYPIATPIAAVLYLSASVGSHPLWVIRPVFAAIVVCLLITATLTSLVGDKHRAGITAWAVIVGLTVDDLRLSLLLLGVGGLLLAIGLAARRTPWRLGPRVTSAMLVFAIVLLAASLLRAMQAGALQADIDEIMFDLGREPPAPAPLSTLPDVYVLLLDAYPGVVAARSEPSFDSAMFSDALAFRGFDVAANARSNYLTTRLTLQSVFGARHAPDVEGLHPGTREQDARALRLATDGGVALRVLGSMGYERIAIPSGYVELGPMRVDRLVVPSELTEMELGIMRVTGAGNVVKVISPDYVEAEARSRVLGTFDAAGAIAEEAHDLPRFVFIHVPAPHAPWVADASGNLVLSGSTAGASERAQDAKRRFFDYATWVGHLTVATIDRILAASSGPPIIAVFSDHGPDFAFDDNDPLASDLDTRTSNFMALLTPDHGQLLPDDATPINLFPYILNPYLQADLPIQPNTIWGWRTNSSILDFVEIDPVTWKAR